MRWLAHWLAELSTLVGSELFHLGRLKMKSTSSLILSSPIRPSRRPDSFCLVGRSTVYGFLSEMTKNGWRVASRDYRRRSRGGVDMAVDEVWWSLDVFRAQHWNIEKRSKISNIRLALVFIHYFSSCSFLNEMAAFPCIMS